MAPLWFKADGTVEEPGDEAASVPIGIMDDIEYELATIAIAPGDRLMLYTDGINEAPLWTAACLESSVCTNW